MSNESRWLLNIACDDVSSKRHMVGLVEAYSIKSADATRLRKLAAHKDKRDGHQTPVQRRMTRLKSSDVARFAEGYRQGDNVREWAKELGVHRSTLHELVRRLELKRLPASVSPEQRVLVEAYEQGATLAELANAHNMGPNRVARQLQAAGVQLRPRGRRPV